MCPYAFFAAVPRVALFGFLSFLFPHSLRIFPQLAHLLLLLCEAAFAMCVHEYKKLFRLSRSNRCLSIVNSFDFNSFNPLVPSPPRSVRPHSCLTHNPSHFAHPISIRFFPHTPRLCMYLNTRLLHVCHILFRKILFYAHWQHDCMSVLSCDTMAILIIIIIFGNIKLKIFQITTTAHAHTLMCVLCDTYEYCAHRLGVYLTNKRLFINA